MKNWMKTTLAASLIAVTGLGTTAVLARGGDCDGPGMRGGKAGWHRMAPEQMQARMAEHADLRLSRLELALAIKPEQQPAWNAFKGAMSERAQRMSAAMAERARQDAPTTVLERMQRMEEMTKLRQTELAETRQAVERFYATLSDAQKKVFDADFGGGRASGGKKGSQDGPRDGGRKGPGRG